MTGMGGMAGLIVDAGWLRFTWVKGLQRLHAISDQTPMITGGGRKVIFGQSNTRLLRT
jgi:hypothetical protein